jgi:hypothetical protein
MAELKTQPTNESVRDFIDGIDDAGVRRDCEPICSRLTMSPIAGRSSAHSATLRTVSRACSQPRMTRSLASARSSAA